VGGGSGYSVKRALKEDSHEFNESLRSCICTGMQVVFLTDLTGEDHAGRRKSLIPAES
jgi:hypothetical protein